MPGDITALPAGFKNVSREDIDRALGEVDKLLEHVKNALSGQGLSLAERYLKGEMGVGIEFRLMEGVTSEFVAFFKRKLAAKVDDITRYGLVANPNQAACGRNDSPVFVENIEAVECPEGVTFPATVRFQPAQDFFAGVVERQLCEAVGKPFRRPVYRKRYVAQFAVGDEGPCGFSNSEANGKRVQRASKVVDTISDEPAEIYRDILGYMQSVDADCRLRIPICDNLVGVSFSKGVNCRFEVLTVFFGPIKFYPATQER